MGIGVFLPEFSSTTCNVETSQGGKPNVHYTVGAGGAIVEIDKRSGKMTVLKMVEAIDVGKAINPSLVRGQMTGGALQGLATVMCEDMKFDNKGKLLNPNFTDYKIPTAKDAPLELDSIMVEHAQTRWSFWSKRSWRTCYDSLCSTYS